MIREEDYKEPVCPLCDPNARTTLPIKRILDKFDAYLYQKEYEAALNHLDYWQKEAIESFDTRAELAILNEKIGLFRCMERADEALAAAEEALTFQKSLGIDGTVTAATTCLNAATAYKAFGQPARAVFLYEEALPVYEKELSDADSRLGGLYNNLALALCEEKNFSSARSYFGKALGVMQKIEDSEPEAAITLCNLADLEAAEKGEIESAPDVEKLLTDAVNLLRSCGKKDGYYAFVCEKLVPAFSYYGFFADAAEFAKEAKEIGEIYERT